MQNFVVLVSSSECEKNIGVITSGVPLEYALGIKRGTRSYHFGPWLWTFLKNREHISCPIFFQKNPCFRSHHFERRLQTFLKNQEYTIATEKFIEKRKMFILHHPQNNTPLHPHSDASEISS